MQNCSKETVTENQQPPSRLHDFTPEQRLQLEKWVKTGERYTIIQEWASKFDPPFAPSWLTIKHLRRQAGINVFKLRRQKFQRILDAHSEEGRARRKRQRDAIAKIVTERLQAAVDRELVRISAALEQVLTAEVGKLVEAVEVELNSAASEAETALPATSPG